MCMHVCTRVSQCACMRACVCARVLCMCAVCLCDACATVLIENTKMHFGPHHAFASSVQICNFRLFAHIYVCTFYHFDMSGKVYMFHLMLVCPTYLIKMVT